VSQQLRLFLAEAMRSLTANLSTTAAATIAVLIGMFVFGLFLAVGSYVNSWRQNLEDQVVVKVFFSADATRAEIEAVRTQVLQFPQTRSMTYVSKEDALREMREKHPELTRDLASNPLPASYTIKPMEAEQVRQVAARLDPPPPGVDSVTYKEKTTEKVLLFADVVKWGSLVGSLILLAASTILIANTIRLSIFSRRREIEVMKLVGATNWFVRGPFMLEGLICGLVGSVVAIVLLVVGKEFALPALPFLERAGSDAEAWSFPLIALAVIGVSLLVGAIGSAITLRRFLRI
jgi:cell division transport system permease protein